MLDHEKVGAYHRSLELLDVTDRILEEANIKAHLRSQLDRAATSVVLNIAEGAGEFSPKEKQRFYRMARRSTTECAALFDILKRRSAVREDLLASAYEHARIVISSLVRLMEGVEKRAKKEAGEWFDESDEDRDDDGEANT
jgi:four helix bundle protein